MSTKILHWLTYQMFPESEPGVFVESIPSSKDTADGVLTGLVKSGWTGCYYGKGKTKHRNIHPNISDLDKLQSLLIGLGYDSFINCAVVKLPTRDDILKNTFFEVFRFGVIMCRHDWNDSLRYLFAKMLNHLKYGCYHRAVSAKHQLPLDIYVARIRKPPYFYRQLIPDLPLPIPGRFLLHRVLKSGTGSMAVLLLKREDNNHKLVLKKCLTDALYQAEKSALLLTSSWRHSPSLIYYDDLRKYLVTEWCGRDLRHAKAQSQDRLRPVIKNLATRLQKNFGIYHNDIRWKNIVRKRGRVVLVDWGFASTDNRERDPQQILT